MHIYSHCENSFLNIGIVGARGYSGVELCRGLLNHPCVASLTLGLNETHFELDQFLPEKITKPVHNKSVDQLVKDVSQLDLVFLATPAEVSMRLAPQFLKSKMRVIDLSGAFRLSTKAAYQKWYNFEHEYSDLLSSAHYGLSPFHLGLNKDSTPLIANPGCYATSILMALVPLLREQVIDPHFIVIDAKSGTTGAGKKASENLLFTEVEGECLPYRITKHQHYPEICEHILKLTGESIRPMFSTTLIPVRRGIISGIYTRIQRGANLASIENAYHKAYEQYPLVNYAHIDKAPHLLSLKKVVGSARTHIVYTLDSDDDGQKLYIYSSIDNLMKGAATQAIENMNHLWNWPVETGLLMREGVL